MLVVHGAWYGMDVPVGCRTCTVHYTCTAWVAVYGALYGMCAGLYGTYVASGATERGGDRVVDQNDTSPDEPEPLLDGEQIASEKAAMSSVACLPLWAAKKARDTASSSTTPNFSRPSKNVG